MIRWYVSRSGKVRGPFTESEVFQLIDSQQLAAGDQTMVEGIDGWIPLERTAPFLIRFGQPAAPAPPNPAPWFEHPAILVLGFFCCWPVGLALIWRHPRVPLWVKLAATVVPIAGVGLELATFRSLFAH